MKSTACVCFAILLAWAGTTAEAREPSELEQYFLELINRARANPNAEVTRLSGLPWGDDGTATPDLNEGLPAGTITATAKQPLAFDPRIIDAATDYADLVLANEAGGHEYGGTNPEERMEARGYVFVPTYGWGENLAITGKYPSNPLNATAVDEHHDGLFIDDNVDGRGHRTNIMDPGFREIGIAIRPDNNGVSRFNPGWIDIQSAQDYAFSNGRVFVTGIVFNDNDANEIFTPNNGEALGGLMIQIRNAGGVVASATTFATGGYSINLAGQAAQTFEFRVIDGSGDVFVKNFAWNGSTNVKVDARDPGFAPTGSVPDLISPQLTYKGPREGARLRRRSTHRGTATDDTQVVRVTYRVAGDRTRNAMFNSVSGAWKFTVNINSPKLRRKKNIRVTIIAHDAAGNFTKLLRKFKRR